jgi:WD40 repeat protein
VNGSEGAVEARLVTDFSDINDIAFLPGGEAVVFRGDVHSARSEKNGRVVVWKLGEPYPHCVLEGIDKLGGPADSSFVATVSYEFPIIMWNISGSVVQLLYGHDGDAYVSTFSRDGRYLFSGGADMTICKWDVASGSLLGRFIGHGSRLESLCVTPDDRILISADSENVRFWRADTCELVATWVMISDKDYAIYTPDQLFYVSDPNLITMYQKLMNEEAVAMTSPGEVRHAQYRFIDPNEVAQRILGV